jgi:DNA-binding transcriptional ArsR family regulator
MKEEQPKTNEKDVQEGAFLRLPITVSERCQDIGTGALDTFVALMRTERDVNGYESSGNWFRATHHMIAQRTPATARTLRRHLPLLEEAGLIEVKRLKKRDDEGQIRNEPNRYRLLWVGYSADNSSVRLKSSANGQKQAIEAGEFPERTNLRTNLNEDLSDNNIKGERENFKKEKNTSIPSSSLKNKEKSEDEFRCLDVIKLWNEIVGQPKAERANSFRKKRVRAIWEEEGKRMEPFEKAFRNVANSKYLRGIHQGSGISPFIANLDWMLKEANWVKVIEGNYNESPVCNHFDDSRFDPNGI